MVYLNGLLNTPVCTEGHMIIFDEIEEDALFKTGRDIMMRAQRKSKDICSSNGNFFLRNELNLFLGNHSLHRN